jgi:hypothetical protein
MKTYTSNQPKLRINPKDRSALQRCLLATAAAFAFCWLGFQPTARAVCQDACLANNNTVQGDDALFSLTVGANNTAIGFDALHSDQNGTNNTAVGFNALFSNVTGYSNTAVGFRALESPASIENTAVGSLALFSNSGNYNTAMGSGAVFGVGGSFNVAVGFDAMTSGGGNYNTAVGVNALYGGPGDHNTAVGYLAGYITSGSNNIALGDGAGINLTTGSNNIDIANYGFAGDSNTIRIGRANIHKNTYIWGISGAVVPGGVGVIIDTKGHLGTVVSSERYKDAIRPMDKASEAILALKPVTFRYKKEFDPDGIPQFGLVAEQVAKVNPNLVATDEEGKPYTVRYEAVNAMLLNEFLKEHRTVQEQQKNISELKSALGQQQKEIEALTAGLQKVSNELALTKPAARVVTNN